MNKVILPIVISAMIVIFILWLLYFPLYPGIDLLIIKIIISIGMIVGVIIILGLGYVIYLLSKR